MPRQPAKAWNEVEGTKEADAARDVDKGRIAAEAFVGSQTAQSDLDASLARGLGDEPGIDAVDGRQIHGIENGRQILLELAAVDGAHDMVCAIAGRNLGGERSLVLRLAAELLEGQGDRE